MAEQLSIILGHFVPVQFIISSGTSSQHASLKKFPQSKNTLKSWLINVHRFLPHEKLDERLQLAQPSPSFPDWWQCGKHDKDLLIGVTK